MNPLKTITLVLTLIILSVTGLRAEEVPPEQIQHLWEEGKQAYYAADYPSALEKWKQGLDLARQSKNQQAIGAFLSNIGMMYDNLGQYQTALDYYQQALKILREIGDRHGESASLLNIGKVYHSLGQYQAALGYYQQALAIHQKISDRRGEGFDLNNIGVVYDNLGQYQIALDYLKQALKIRREIGDRREEGSNLTNIGMVYDNLGQYQTALDYLKQALKIGREINDRRGVGNNLTNISVVYRNLGQYQTALDYLKRALTIHQKIGYRRGESSDLSNIGVVYSRLGQYQIALDSLQQALKIRREIGNKRGIGDNLADIGMVYYNLGQYQTALDYYQQALAIHQKIGDRRGESSDLNNIGVVYENLGQYQTALGSLQQALAIHQKIGNRRREGSDLTNLGNVYRNLGQYQTALDSLQQALAIHQEIGDKYGESSDLTNIGVVYQNLEQYQIALDYYQQTLAIHEKIVDRHGKGSALINIGVVHEYFGDYHKAKEVFQNSVTILETISSSSLWKAQRGLAFAEAKLDQIEFAIQHYEQAIDNIEKLRAGLSQKEHKLFFMPNKVFVYDDFITLLQILHQQQPQKSYDRKAFETFERKQARVFLEDIGKSGARLFAKIPEAIPQQEQFLADQIAKIRENLVQQRAKFFLQQNKVHITSLTQKLVQLEKEQKALEAQIKEEHPEYYALKYPQPVKLKTLQEEVLREGEFMLVYNVMENNIALWVIGKQVFQLLILDISELDLNAKVETFRPNELIKAIEGKSPDLPNISENTLAIMLQTGYELYTLLLPAEARALLKDVHTLYIIPTGSLYGLPFGALNTKNPDKSETLHYLIQDYPIAYLSSASLLKTLRDTKRKTTQRYPLLAFAHPKYPKTCPKELGSATTNVIQVARTEEYFKLMGSNKKNCFTEDDELPQTKIEANAIADELKLPQNRDAFLQLRDKASRQNVFTFNQQQRLDDYQYVLFAAHAVLPEKVDYLTQPAIVLSRSELEPLNAGYLTRDDVFGLQMNADLVALSACNTGGGEKIKGEGIRGLTRAFMFAGTPAVSVTLWDVSANSAKYLSIGLFKYLQQGKPLAEALRQSKLDFLTNPKYASMFKKHPFFWAPTVVFGDGG